MQRCALCLIAVVLFSCTNTTYRHRPAIDSLHYSENHRPQYHFSPAKQWTNDPNGLVFYKGEYHLFYQHNPYAMTQGHLSWGHAVSKDLLHWEHLPVALDEYTDPVSGDSIEIFSGTVVVDNNNSSGLCDGKNCLVAIYTSNVHKNHQGLRQHQSLACSNDQGRTWKRYAKNPILDIQRKDFRDPKVFWYEPLQNWVMAVIIPDLFKVQFYKSKNLLDWSLTGEFGSIGDTTKIWECPDLYELPIENQPGKSKWVLSLSGSHPQGPAFVGMQYFVGTFDGSKFIADDPKQPARYVDYGKDFYAGIVINHLPKEDKRTIMIGWMNNWPYANQIPTSPWRGVMSIPRELSLRNTEAGIQLVQRPIESIYSLRKKELINLTESFDKSLNIEMRFDPTHFVGVQLLKNEKDETILGYNIKSQELFLDRTHSGDIGFNKDFASIERVKVKLVDGEIRLSIFIDQSTIEIFVNDGEQTLSEQVFPTHTKAFIDRLPGTDYNMRVWEMKSVWKPSVQN